MAMLNPDVDSEAMDVVENMFAQCPVCLVKVKVAWLTKPDGRRVLVALDICDCDG